MRCPFCGSAESQVLATRKIGKTKNVIRRNRECENGHRFETFEVSRVHYRSTLSECTLNSESADRKAQLWHRNQDIIQRVEAGEKHASIAQRYGLADNTIFSVLRKWAPHLLKSRNG